MGEFRKDISEDFKGPLIGFKAADEAGGVVL